MKAARPESEEGSFQQVEGKQESKGSEFMVHLGEGGGSVQQMLAGGYS